MTAMDKAIDAWGQPLPDWVQALAKVCDATSLRGTASQLGISPASLSLAIGKKRTRLDFVKNRVEAVLMTATVVCPVLGSLTTDVCLREQARPFSSANPLSVQLFRACRGGCPNYAPKEKKK